MTAPRFLRRRPEPRPYIVSVSNHWRVTPAGARREVTVREPDGALATWLVADEHRALVAFLERAAVAA